MAELAIGIYGDLNEPQPVAAIRRYFRGEIDYETMRAAEQAWDPIERAAWLMQQQTRLIAENNRLRARLNRYEGEPTNMTIYVQSHRGDGTTVIMDAADNTAFVIRTADWPQVAALPNEQQRARLQEIQVNEQEQDR